MPSYITKPAKAGRSVPCQPVEACPEKNENALFHEIV